MRKFLVPMAITLAVASAARGNLVTNGSFEVGGFVPNPDNSMSIPLGGTAITGWTVISSELAWIGPANPFGIVASNGSFSLDLTGYHDTPPYGGVEQSLATDVGALYLLEFDLGTFGPAGVVRSIQATAGATSAVFDATATKASHEWTRFGLQFLATSSSTKIQLVGTKVGGIYIGLDNVSVELLRPAAVTAPEPATLTLAAIPLAVGFLLRRARRRAAA